MARRSTYDSFGYEFVLPSVSKVEFPMLIIQRVASWPRSSKPEPAYSGRYAEQSATAIRKLLSASFMANNLLGNPNFVTVSLSPNYLPF